MEIICALHLHLHQDRKKWRNIWYEIHERLSLSPNNFITRQCHVFFNFKIFLGLTHFANMIIIDHCCSWIHHSSQNEHTTRQCIMELDMLREQNACNVWEKIVKVILETGSSPGTKQWLVSIRRTICIMFWQPTQQNNCRNCTRLQCFAGEMYSK